MSEPLTELRGESVSVGEGIARPLRLGIVPYLNVQPLIWALKDSAYHARIELHASEPRLLAAELERGEHDAAIVPVFEYLRKPDYYSIVPGVSIAARDAVASVLLFSSCELREIRRVHLDPASLTSVNMLKVVLAEQGVKPEYVEGEWIAGEQLRRGDAALLIGDPALQERFPHPYRYDMGLVWKELTGLPFVFAAWLVHPAAAESALSEVLLDAKRYGTENLEAIACEAAPRFGLDAVAAYRYFRENLCYDLRDDELAGWRRFAELCVKHGLIERVPSFRMHDR